MYVIIYTYINKPLTLSSLNDDIFHGVHGLPLNHTFIDGDHLMTDDDLMALFD